jgi:NAD-dependent protein deacetylase/lipoamidase
MKDKIAALSQYLRQSRRILLFTGAGVSTASGIPDFRGPQGVWTRRKPVYYQEFMTSEAARIEHWDYKLEGLPAMAAAQPNDVHLAIVTLEKADRVLMVVTQNIDGLHSLAGTSPDRLVELHGTNAMVECQSCQARSNPQPHYDYFRQYRKCPVCECGGYLKIATISFGQSLSPEILGRASDAATKADLVVALGSTLSVYPAASIPMLAAERGTPYIIINKGPTDHDGLPLVTMRVEGDVEKVFPEAVAATLR